MWTAAKEREEEVYNSARGDFMTKVRFWSYRKIKNRENYVKKLLVGWKCQSFMFWAPSSAVWN